jgi:hypothetical protein
VAEEEAKLDSYTPTPRENLRYKLTDWLSSTLDDDRPGFLGIDPYKAYRFAGRVTGVENASDGSGGIGLADFSPVSPFLAGPEIKRDFQTARATDDKLGMGMAVGEGVLETAAAIPVAGVALKGAAKGIKTLADTLTDSYDPSMVGGNLGNVFSTSAKAAEEVDAPSSIQDSPETPESLDQLAEDVSVTGVRASSPYKNTVKAYKLFQVKPSKPDEFFPLFVNTDKSTPMGQWVDAEIGPAAKGGRVQSLIGDLSFRPGWHSGDYISATHIGGKTDRTLSGPDYRKANQVWVEVEVPADVDWQTEATSRARTKADGELDLSTAEIKDQIPEGGFYRYKTNPNMQGNWLISGSMKINRVLDADEVKAIQEDTGIFDLPTLPEVIDQKGLKFEDLTKSAQAELKRYYPEKYNAMMGNDVDVQMQQLGAETTDTDVQMQDILQARAGQMELPTADRIQPSGSEPLFDLSPESYERTLPEQSEIYVPRPPAGTNRPMPKNDRARKVQENIEPIAQRLAERMEPWLGTEAQYFYHTGPIVDKAMNLGYSAEEIYDWLREFADAYAATSPRTETAQNIRNATLVMAKKQLGLDIREVVGPGGTGINEKGYPMMIGLKGEIGEKGKPNTSDGIHKKLVNAVQDGDGIDPDTNTKPYTFAENVYGNLDGSTIDTHAIRGALDAMNEIEPGSIPIDFIKKDFRDQYKADPSSLDPASMIDDSLGKQTFNKKSMQTEYAVFSDLYRRAGEILGVSPAEAQAMGWFGSGESTGLASELKSVARLLDERIDVTAQAMSQDKETIFRKLLAREIPIMSLFGAAAVGSEGLMSEPGQGI